MLVGTQDKLHRSPGFTWSEEEVMVKDKNVSALRSTYVSKGTVPFLS